MNHRGIWLTAGVLAVIVLLAQIAGASTREALSVAGEATVSAETSTAATISLPAQASAIALETSAAGLATANEAKANESASERGEIADRADKDEANEVAVTAPAAAPRDNTTGARPGFGCGDPNHKHSGPPGRPGATPPPNCTKP